MAKIGYARVSTTEQNLEIQQSALVKAGCEEIYYEKLSGLDDKRPELQKCLDYLRKGDVLVITKLDRLARSVLHLCEIQKQLEKNHIDFIVLDQNIDTSTPTGKLMFNVLASVAEFETAIRAERCALGVAKARLAGKYEKQKAITDEQLLTMRAERESGVLVKDLMVKYNISKATFYRHLNAK